MTPDSSRIALAQRLAEAARAAILPHYRSRLDVIAKDDASPVTLADRGAEQAMRELIEAHLPQDGIIGEEYGKQREDAEWVWVLDPVDGTKSFICGRPTFVSLIGLLHRGVPVLGVIDQAVLDERWVGVTGRPTTFNGSPISTSQADTLALSRLGSTGPEYFTVAGSASLAALVRQTRFMQWGGDGYLYGQLAFGGLELVVEEGLKLHDFAALIPVIEGAGGVMTDWEGGRLDANSAGRVLAVANRTLHAQAVAALRGAA
ncbi:inositol monophosphatase family protein [Chitinimonas lacunae]|uniref:Inositol monophosphatase family protein n=1 Tax=Chitinimonas lacunae TaxID=1963018 RepID=A0ABV8MQ37_9NEIS